VPCIWPVNRSIKWWAFWTRQFRHLNLIVKYIIDNWQWEGACLFARPHDKN
jgi:hypothetical protein